MPDEEIQIVRRIRHDISQECEHDVHRVIAYYRSAQRELKESGRYRFERSGQIPDANHDAQNSG